MQKKRYSKATISRITNERRNKKKEQLETHTKNMEKIRKNFHTQRIEYPEYQESYDYVDELFPSSNVKKVSIMKVSPELLERLGYGGAGGFYDKNSKDIVIAAYKLVHENPYYAYHNLSVVAKITKDEVIAHELCHYAFVEEGNYYDSKNKELWEEFAYGWTLGYLRKKGFSDKEIIKNNYLPFLVEIMSEKAFCQILAQNNILRKQYNSYSKYKKESFWKKYRRKYHEKRKELAFERGWEIVELYNRKMQGDFIPETPVKTSRFGLMDI